MATLVFRSCVFWGIWEVERGKRNGSSRSFLIAWWVRSQPRQHIPCLKKNKEVMSLIQLNSFNSWPGVNFRSSSWGISQFIASVQWPPESGTLNSSINWELSRNPSFGLHPVPQDQELCLCPSVWFFQAFQWFWYMWKFRSSKVTLIHKACQQFPTSVDGTWKMAAGLWHDKSCISRGWAQKQKRIKAGNRKEIKWFPKLDMLG